MIRTALLVVAVSGCDVWKAPDRVKELEGRVDELSSVVSALAGKRVGDKPTGDGHGSAAKPADHHANAEGEGSGSSHEADSAGSAHDAVADQGAHEPAAAHAAHWAYDGKAAPANWAALDPAWKACDGKQQSPIDIEPRAAKASAITFRYQPSEARAIDNGHTLQVNLAPGSRIDIDDRSYELVQFHVHTPSEHTIAGEQLPLEVHLVHKGPGDKLAVIGVLYDAGGDSKALDAVWSKWPKKPDVEVKLSKPFDPSALLPETRTVFRYTGSLTTPPCTEGVLWNVMRRTKTLAQRQLDVLKQHYPANARPIMPLGERTVL